MCSAFRFDLMPISFKVQNFQVSYYTNIATQKFKQCKTQKDLYKNYEDFFKKMKIYLTQQFKKA